MYYYIYTTINLINGKVYHGKHKTKNINDGYLGSGTYLKRAIKKYGEENFNRVIRMFCRNEDIMNEMEEHLSYIEDWVGDKNCYNLRQGGDGGFDHITKVQMVERNRNNAAVRDYSDPVFIENLKASGVGGFRSEEHRRKSIKQALLNIQNGLCDTKGSHKSDEFKRQRSEATKGKLNPNYGNVVCVKRDAIDCNNRKPFKPDAIQDGWTPVYEWKSQFKDTSKSAYGKHWYNDGTRNYFRFKKDAEGLTKGRLMIGNLVVPINKT